MNSEEYLGYLSKKFRVDTIMEGTRDSLDAQMKREGKPFVSFAGTHRSGEEVVTEAWNRQRLILDRIQSLQAGSDIELRERPILGYLPTLDLNAVSTLAPNGDPIILLDVQLRSVLHTFASFLFYLGNEAKTRGGLSEVSEEVIFVTLKAIGAGIRLFLRDKEAHSDFMDAWKWMVYKVPPEIPETGDLLCDVLIMYILSHEYAHHALGHVSRSTIKRYELSKGQTPIELAIASQLQQRDADELALKIFLKCQGQDSELLAFRHVEEFLFAPLLFFDIISTVEATSHFRKRPIRVHPPALERQRLLSDKVMTRLDQRRRGN
ncbi:MAG: hypothetical protein JSU94_04445 [Phycisphaerales bacterium]|nr:MAG: hypothetical protein JSU94_04445 [Phycisphaerales bacterium]